ncbi:hypothetical protein [Streptomyces sp. NPDC014746]
MRDQSRTLPRGRTLRPPAVVIATIAALTLTACSGTEAPDRSFDVTPS